MKTHLIILVFFIFQYCAGQSSALPKCIKEGLTEKKVPEKETRKIILPQRIETYEGELKLPTGETVYKFYVKRPQGCMDCPSGSIFKNSLCKTIANFTIAKARNKKVDEGYDISWFLPRESSNKPTETPTAKDSEVRFFEQFKNPVKLKVKKSFQKTNPLKIQIGDLVTISSADGLSITRNGKKISQYKLIPETANFTQQIRCVVAPCPAGILSKSYFRWDNLGINLLQDQDNNYSLFLYDFKTNENLDNKAWTEVLQLEKITTN